MDFFKTSPVREGARDCMTGFHDRPAPAMICTALSDNPGCAARCALSPGRNFLQRLVCHAFLCYNQQPLLNLKQRVEKVLRRTGLIEDSI